MTDRAIELEIRTYLATSVLFEAGLDDVPADLPLLNGRLDSLALHRLIVFLEEEFDVELDDADMSDRNFATPHDIARLVSSKRS